MTPGVSFILTIRNSLSHGRRAGLLIAAGLTSIDIAYAVFAVFGITSLISSSVVTLNMIAVLGGLWLVYLGVSILKDLFNIKFGKTKLTEDSQISINQGLEKKPNFYRVGVSCGLSNPQGIVFFSSIFLSGAGHLTILTSIIVLVLLAIVSILLRGGIAVGVTIPKVNEWYFVNQMKVQFVSGLALAILGGKLVVKSLLFLIA